MLLRLCRALAGFGIFTVDAAGTIGQTERSACLRRGAWGNLEHAVRIGEAAFDATFGMPKFEYLKAHPDEAAAFDRFMQHGPEDRHAAVAAAHDFSRAGLVVDIGGGTGAQPTVIMDAHPGVRGLLFDREHVVAGAGDAAPFGVMVGSFFDAVPSGGDVSLWSLILHDWDDATAQTILARVHAAMTPGARLLIIERLIEDEPGRTDRMTLLPDINMMASLHGRERTVAEFSQVLQASGSSAPKLVRTHMPMAVLGSRRDWAATGTGHPVS